MAPIFAVTLGEAAMWSDAPVGYNIVVAAQLPGGTDAPPPSGGDLLLETGPPILLESGGPILLEA